MSFIKLAGINDTQEPKVAPEGRYPLVITSAKVKESKDKEGNNILVVLDIEDSEKYQSIFHYISLPREGDDKEKNYQRLLNAKRFFAQFNISMDDGVDTEAMVGSRAEGNVGVEEYNDEPKNVLKVDRLRSEG